MSVADDMKALLVADDAWAAALTGGTYTYEGTGRLGINRDKTPDAFNATTGVLKPCAVVKGRAEVPDGGVADDDTQDVSYRQVVEVWVYDDGDAGYSAIETALSRAFTVLHGQRAGTRLMRWINTLNNERDNVLDNACMARAEYAVWGLK